MRMIGGLVGLLACVAIGVWIWQINATKAVEDSKPARDLANQLAGQDANGVKAKDSIKFVPMTQGDKVRSLLVDDIMPDGPMAKYYGLKRNDTIIQAGSFSFRDESDAKLCEAMTFDAFSKTLPLIVMREGQQITLPLAAAPAPPGNQNESSKTSLQKQLDAIQGGGR